MAFVGVLVLLFIIDILDSLMPFRSLWQPALELRDPGHQATGTIG